MEKLLLIGEQVAGDGDAERVAQHEEYEIHKAKDREEGLQVFRAEQPAVVIIEHPLGEQDGVEILKEICDVEPTCEVILVTARGEMEIAIDALRGGALDYLRLPIDPEQLRVALGRARERRNNKKVSESPVILILEDHEQTRKRVARVLEKEGYRVLTASDGEEGLLLFEERRVDLILADVRMPRRDGLSVLRETKGKGADVEVIVVTGYGDEDIVVQALRAGAINFLKKPIDIEQMLLAIHKALEHQTACRSLAYRNRDIELMQELVVRLTKRLELVVETPKKLSAEATRFLHELVDALPFGIAVLGSDRRLVFANRHVAPQISDPPPQLGTEWLQSVGVRGLDEEEVNKAFRRSMTAVPGSVETVMLSKWAFLVMTPIKLITPEATERFVALAIRGERNTGKT